jgi:hypothetical protein
MRPTASEILVGLRAMLLHDILPEASAPHLRTQVMLAVGMVNSAAAEIEDAAASLIAERARMIALAREVHGHVQEAAPDDPLAADLAALAGAPAEPADYRLSALTAESERLRGILDRLDEFCDDRAADGSAREAMRRSIDAELRAGVAERLRWTAGGPQG